MSTFIELRLTKTEINCEMYGRQQFAIVGISNTSNVWTRKLALVKSVVCSFILYMTIVAQFLYIFYVVNGFMEYVECISASACSIILFVWFLAIVYRKSTIFEIIDNMEKLIDTRCKYPKSEAFFSKINQQVEQLSEIVFKLIMKILLQIIMLPKLVVSFGLYFITDAGSDAFQLPFRLWFPFDWNNPIGYLMAVTSEYTIFGLQMFVIASTMALGVGSFWLTISVTKEIRRVLNSINKKAHSNENQSAEWKIMLSEYIYAHAIIKQMILDFSDILQPIILSLFTYSLLALSGTMLIIQMEIVHHESDMPLLLLIFNGIFAFIAVFIACELGQRVSDAFEKIDITIDKFDWYLFPIEIQQMLPMIITNAQQPVELECFGSITCSRIVFKKVINRAYSYFMVLRQLSN